MRANSFKFLSLSVSAQLGLLLLCLTVFLCLALALGFSPIFGLGLPQFTLAILILGSILSGLHFSLGWLMIYFNPLAWEKFGKRRMLFEFFLLPLVYGVAFVGIFLWLASFAPFLAFVFYLATNVIFGSYHHLRQDAGVISLLSLEASFRWRRIFNWVLLPLAISLVVFTLLKNFPTEMAWVNGSIGKNVWMGLGAFFILASLFLVGRIQISADSLLLSLYFVWVLCWSALSPALLLAFGLTGGLAIRTILTMRHNLIYSLLVSRFFNHSSITNRINRTKLILIAVAVAILFAAMFLAILDGLQFQAAPDLVFPEVGFLSGLSQFQRLVCLGIFGAINLHHFHLDARVWKFSDPNFGPVLREVFLSSKVR